MKRPIRPKHCIVTEYWLTYYAGDHCTLCGNLGTIDTTAIKTPAGKPVGRVNFCICPNGQAMRAASIKASENFRKLTRNAGAKVLEEIERDRVSKQEEKI